MRPGLHAAGVGVRIGAATLLDGVCLEVRPGEVLALVGANGAGKSTLLSVLSGERRPSTGEATLDGRPLHRWPRRDLARRRAVVLQGDALSFGFTAEEVVLLGREPHLRGAPGPRDRAVAAAALALAGADHLAHRRVPTLSGGERQRVRLARALAQLWEPRPDGPRFLLLDEPTSAQDLAHGHALLGLCRRLACQGLGVLVVLHDLAHAARHADRVALLHRGRLLAAGPPAEVLTPAAVGHAFGVEVDVRRHPLLDTPLVTPLELP